MRETDRRQTDRHIDRGERGKKREEKKARGNQNLEIQVLILA